MSDLTPDEILNAYNSNELDKTSVINYLKSFVESSEEEKLRVRSVECLIKLFPGNHELFKFFENLLVSDHNDKIEALAAKYIIKFFLKKGTNAIKLVMNRKWSQRCLLTIVNELKAINNKESLGLIAYMEKTVGKYYIEEYNIVPSEALALGIFNYPPVHFETKHGHVVRIYGHETFPNLEALALLPFLERLEIKDGSKKDLKGIGKLTNLKVLELNSVNLRSAEYIHEIKSLVKLGKLEILFNDNIEHLNFVSNLVNLEILGITGGLDGDWFGKIREIEGLEHLMNLKELNLEGHKITEIKGLETLVNLEKLSLCGNEISEIKGLETLVNLKYLDLSNNKITEIKGLEDLHNLETLILVNNQITEIKELENLESLKRFVIWGNNIPEIKELDFSYSESPQEFVNYCRKRRNL